MPAARSGESLLSDWLSLFFLGWNILADNKTSLTARESKDRSIPALLALQEGKATGRGYKCHEGTNPQGLLQLKSNVNDRDFLSLMGKC